MQTLTVAVSANLRIITQSRDIYDRSEIFRDNGIVELRNIWEGRSKLGFIVDLYLRLRSSVPRGLTRGSAWNLIPILSIFQIVFHVGKGGDLCTRGRIPYNRSGDRFALQLRVQLENRD